MCALVHTENIPSSMEISFSSHPNFDKRIPSKFCAPHYRTAVFFKRYDIWECNCSQSILHWIHIFLIKCQCIMTSSNGNIFRLTGHLCDSPHKGQWRGALMFSLICVWINDWVNNREAGDLRRYHAHYDVIIMEMDTCYLQVTCKFHIMTK